jgi:hypothetical protein
VQVGIVGLYKGRDIFQKEILRTHVKNGEKIQKGEAMKLLPQTREKRSHMESLQAYVPVSEEVQVIEHLSSFQYGNAALTLGFPLISLGTLLAAIFIK